MHRGDQDRELWLSDVLQLVDEDRERRPGGLGGEPDLLDERLQVLLEVTIVGEPGLRLVVETHFDVAELHLQLGREAGECAQAADRECARGLDLAQA